MANSVLEVTINVNPLTKDISMDQDPFIVHKLQDQVVKWSCSDPNQYFTVEFGNGSPFYESQFSKDHPCSGIVRRNIEPDKNRKYKYTVRVGDKVLDPEGAVDK